MQKNELSTPQDVIKALQCRKLLMGGQILHFRFFAAKKNIIFVCAHNLSYINNVKLEEVNELASSLLDPENLFFVEVGKNTQGQ